MNNYVVQNLIKIQNQEKQGIQREQGRTDSFWTSSAKEGATWGGGIGSRRRLPALWQDSPSHRKRSRTRGWLEEATGPSSSNSLSVHLPGDSCETRKHFITPQRTCVYPSRRFWYSGYHTQLMGNDTRDK